jgi:hypothetical protein
VLRAEYGAAWTARLSPVRASTRIFRWYLIVGWVRPDTLAPAAMDAILGCPELYRQ